MLFSIVSISSMRQWQNSRAVSMREFLDDAHAHREDGYGRAQAHLKRELPKRFYKDATVQALDGGYAVGLDGRVPRTPGMKHVVVTSEALAREMAREWSAQGQFIDPETMPLVRLVNAGVEVGEESKPALRDEIVKYAGNDMLLYRANAPESLVRRQEVVWDDVLVKLARRFGVAFQPTVGILHQPQPQQTLERLSSALTDEPLLPLTAMNSIMSITGSGLLAIALRHGLVTAEEVWVAAHVDEDHQIGLWGEVEEITTRRAKRRSEFDAAVCVLELLSR
jgi:chaperone required for assembly of F1-ATPase